MNASPGIRGKEKKVAYESLAHEKISAIQVFKKRALLEDSELMYVPIEPLVDN